MGWWTADRQSYALNYLVSRGGLSPIGAAGLVSRWANVESSQGPASINPYSGAFGIAQWLGARLPPIRGNTSFEAQLAYVVRELNSTESRAGQILRNATSADVGAVGASTYERAEGYNAATGRDNFTARTASGIPAVLATSAVGNTDINFPPALGDPFGDLTGNVFDTPVAGGVAIGGLAIGLAALVLIWALFSD